MPIFDYLCEDCGKTKEILIKDTGKAPECPDCGSSNMKKLVSAHSSISGPTKNSMPGPADTGCCGSSPGESPDCAGPGSCCGKNFG